MSRLWGSRAFHTHIASTPALANSNDDVQALRSAFSAYFDDVKDQVRETTSEDFTVLANAVVAPYGFWYFRITDHSEWDRAKGAGKLSEIQGPTLPFLRPPSSRL